MIANKTLGLTDETFDLAGKTPENGGFDVI